MKRLDESLKFETLYKSITGHCLNGIDISKIKVDNGSIVYRDRLVKMAKTGGCNPPNAGSNPTAIS